ncbi:MAG: hypothetical protein JW958_03755 [Candidatus Eisenbacteria bacterium]|nr:hypothetical protein [Candidatus Eisenbacteria bacterium]
MTRNGKKRAVWFSLLTVLALTFVLAVGCGDDDDNPADNGGNGGNGEGTFVSVPSQWVGVWKDSTHIEYTVGEMQFSFSDTVTVTICPEMPADSAAGLPPQCTFTWNGNTLTVACTQTDTTEACETTIDLEFTETVSAGSYQGNGTMEMTYGAGCGELAGETVTATYSVVGTRIGDVPDPCVPDVGPVGTGGDTPVDPGTGSFTATITNGGTTDVDFTGAEALVYYDSGEGYYSISVNLGDTPSFIFTTPSPTTTGTYGLSDLPTGNQVGVVYGDPDGLTESAGGTLTITEATSSHIVGSFDFDVEITTTSQSTINKTVTGSFDLGVDFAGKVPEQMVLDRMLRMIRGGCPSCP